MIVKKLTKLLFGTLILMATLVVLSGMLAKDPSLALPILALIAAVLMFKQILRFLRLLFIVMVVLVLLATSIAQMGTSDNPIGGLLALVLVSGGAYMILRRRQHQREESTRVSTVERTPVLPYTRDEP